MTAFSRRALLGAACCAPAAALTATAVHAAPPNPPRTRLTPDQALAVLVAGNRAFISDRGVPAANAGVGRQRRLEIARSQSPLAVLVSCSDSRVPPELLFGRGLGELFIVRNAGNTVDTTALGSIEYGVAVLGAPLVVVMGHERCGAVEAAVSVVRDNATFPGSIGQMIEPIVPAVLQAQRDGGDLLDNAVRRNVSRTVERLRTASEPLLLDPIKAGRLRIVGARYDLDDGSVDFFDTIPAKAAA